MRNNIMEFIPVERYNIRLRFVEENDAEFILRLRTDERLGRFLSPTTPDLAAQKKWIAAYKHRERAGEEYYFITEDLEGKAWGTTRLSELTGDCFELGSWLFDRETPKGIAIKADLITKEIGFTELDFDCCKFDVRKLNTSVLRYHKGFNPVVVNENDLNVYFNLYKASFENYRDKLIKHL